MLEAYSVGNTLATNDVIPFDSVSLLKGTTAMLAGTSTIQLNKCGVYMVHAVVTGTPSAAGTAKIDMYRDGVLQTQAEVRLPTTVTTASVTLPIMTLVQVTDNNTCCCCTKPTMLQFVDTGVGLTNADAKVVVTKLC